MWHGPRLERGTGDGHRSLAGQYPPSSRGREVFDAASVNKCGGVGVMGNHKDRLRQEVNDMYWDRVEQETTNMISEGLGEVVIHPKIQERIERCLKNYRRKKPSV